MTRPAGRLWRRRLDAWRVLALLVGLSSMLAFAAFRVWGPQGDHRAVKRNADRATSAYHQDALRIVLQEANRLARVLKLPEKLPITHADVRHLSMSFPPPKEFIGELYTDRFVYAIAKRSLRVRDLRYVKSSEEPKRAKFENELKAKYMWPISRMDTNAAVALATSLLEAASMDVDALLRDPDVRVEAGARTFGDRFVPFYEVTWYKGDGWIVIVEFVEPTRSVIQVWVSAAYGRRRPLEVPGRAALDQALDAYWQQRQQEAAKAASSPPRRENDGDRAGVDQLNFTTLAYQKEALRLLLEEAGRVAHSLQLSEKLPITEADLVDVYLSPPALSDLNQTIGTIATKNFRYSVAQGRKLCYVIREFGRADGHSRFLEELKAQYLQPLSREDTNAAVALATNWLAAASMNVEALQRDCQVVAGGWRPGGAFVPVYWVRWIKGERLLASVELVEPTRSLVQLGVFDAAYIQRKPLEIPNRAALLRETNQPRPAAHEPKPSP